jgi:hypothetical protein
VDWLGAQPNPSLDGGAKPNQTLELRRKKKKVPPRLTEEGRRGENPRSTERHWPHRGQGGRRRRKQERKKGSPYANQTPGLTEASWGKEEEKIGSPNRLAIFKNQGY